MGNIITSFEETVRRFPEKTAVAFREDRLSFRELQMRARKLAETICGIHAGPACGEPGPVPVVVDRGVNSVVYFLAVVYSGNYYVPLDPELPAEKKRKILKDCQAELVLCGPKHVKELESLQLPVHCFVPESAGKNAAEKGTDLPSLTGEAAEPEFFVPLPGEALTEDSPLYMVYTSGSTGMPKGVLKDHGAVLDFIMAYAGEFQLDDREIIGNQTPFFFDASAKDLYLMLCTGATMEILPAELFVFPVTLIRYLNERRITYACWVPTAFAIVTQLNTFKEVLPETLKKAFFVGEVFPIKQLRKWFDTLPEIQYVNLYGSTELAGISCYCRLDPAKEYESIPLGRALPNCQVFLTDGDTIVTEPGQLGEVCVSSRALAKGYYQDPQKTEAVFARRNCPDGVVRRTLMTGDLARYDEDGQLVFVSRKDFQIKHQGRRIELGEIESIADQLPQIVRCCCLYQQEKKKICFFCEVTEESGWDKRSVKHALKETLTEYMMPQKITVLEHLPLNANGKIDRTALKQQM